MSQQPLRYGLLTVWLDKTFATREETFQEIKKLLGLENPVIDEKLGTFPYARGVAINPEHYNAPKNSVLYVVGVEIGAIQKLAKTKPNIAGCFHSMLYTADHRPSFSISQGGNKRTNQGPKP